MAKVKKEKHVLAVKDFEKTFDEILSGKMVMPKPKEEYQQIKDGVTQKCTTYSGLGKFIRQNRFNKKDCMHFWENLITEGYILVTVEISNADENFMENACDGKNLKYVAKAK
ncbi:MAG: hypothetical protein R6W96_08800 [Clostridia bacterium]